MSDGALPGDAQVAQRSRSIMTGSVVLVAAAAIAFVVAALRPRRVRT